MTDITTRLLSMSEAMYFDRDQDELDALLLEAKAEIERLREALKPVTREDLCGFIRDKAESHMGMLQADFWPFLAMYLLDNFLIQRAALIPSEQKGDADGKQ